jgi:hypothetical protein
MRIASVVLCFVLAGCAGRTASRPGAVAPLSDSAFATLQARGGSAHGMGVDQSTSAHRFDDLPDGGRIVLQTTTADSAAVQQIRMHLHHIASAFAEGSCDIPMFVHDRAEVPGTRGMRERRALITYALSELPGGGELRIRTTDPAALQAVHAFLAFQRSDHRAPGHASH